MWPFRNKHRNKNAPPRTLEEKLDALSACGISMKPEFSIEDLLSSWDRSDYEKPGYDLVLAGLGMAQEQSPWPWRSRNIWHIDFECIEDHGAYISIATRMAELAGGSLPITAVQDFVDVENGQAWLAFELDGQPIHIDCEVNNDWVDSRVFSHFVRLLAERDPSRIYFIYGLGQDSIIGCLDTDHFQRLRKLIPQVKPLT